MSILCAAEVVAAPFTGDDWKNRGDEETTFCLTARGVP